MNVAHVVSLMSERQCMADIQPYQEPYKTGLKVGQYSQVPWDATKSTYDSMLKRVRKSINQPEISEDSSAAFAVSKDFVRDPDNVYTSILEKYGLQHVWPAWDDAEVPTKTWET